MRTIHIRVRHDDHFVVAQLGNIEIIDPDACTETVIKVVISWLDNILSRRAFSHSESYRAKILGSHGLGLAWLNHPQNHPPLSRALSVRVFS